MTDVPSDPDSPANPGAFAAAAATSEPAPMSTPAQPAASRREAVKVTHVGRGILWGILLGLGLTIVAIVTQTISLSLVPAIIVFLLGVVLGAAWSLFGPAKPAGDGA